MHRTQICFDKPLFSEIKQQASRLNMSVSAYIRETLKKDIANQQDKSEPIDFSEFAGMWKDYDISQVGQSHQNALDKLSMLLIDVSFWIPDEFNSYRLNSSPFFSHS